ncbi:hypothetical protein [Pseudosulfitobacter pseudonitzschiae]|uniref:hypothetical protein n=1 Tax=Pseudosulfitobacter pseudonitzschiae TaxID=1402135 RepID=UPI001AF2CD24|nr:hypothetical protein [Pseudosulfitobacter pseudonitzschiae]MBM1817759.1 hypothetical protein [Pseudosulfitobacter pseudonitzschiae]MBM1834754.1 hypothetical protein [Pseudosulfitobacter pseudonitzschiae]MBM1839618.1 hypothetical protein [Pseudosulfitobacter pseudonitzschiae]MBM1844469.1 hypothetical protein [Pseudosulfitobacter pseudonitzschiae]MBM1849303.1 hypothetical protein [Pseudosulfitobacter pseudonitzschiae]
MTRFTALTAALILSALPVLAADPAPLKQAEASRVLYDTGVATRDPLLVLAAAKMRRGLGLSPTDRMAEDGTPGDGALDADAMLATARDLAAGDDMMLGLIEDVASETTKGVVSGPVYNNARIGGGQTDTYRAVPFEGGTYAEIYVEAKGSNDLNLKVTDDQGRLVCSDTDSSAIAYCGWSPRRTGDFTIAVQNASGSSADYALITN